MADSEAGSSAEGRVAIVICGIGIDPTHATASYHEIKAKHQQAIARRKRTLVKGLLSTFVVLTTLVFMFNLVDFDSFGPGVTLASYRRLHIGMGEREVQAIMGTSGQNIVPVREENVRPLQDDEMYWKGKKLVIYVAFAKDNRVRQVSMTWHDSTPQPESLTGIFSRWFAFKKK